MEALLFWLSRQQRVLHPLLHLLQEAGAAPPGWADIERKRQTQRQPFLRLSQILQPLESQWLLIKGAALERW